jgi:phage shock protein E
MRRLAMQLFLPVVAVTLLAACGNSTSQKPAGGAATTQEAKVQFANINVDRFEEMSRQTGVVILDVRTPEEFAQGHLRGAVNINVGAPNFAQKVAALDKNATCLVFCRSGRRSAQACGEMAGLGFSCLYNLEGGINAWTARGKPLEQ